MEEELILAIAEKLQMAHMIAMKQKPKDLAIFTYYMGHCQMINIHCDVYGNYAEDGEQNTIFRAEICFSWGEPSEKLAELDKAIIDLNNIVMRFENGEFDHLKQSEVAA